MVTHRLRERDHRVGCAPGRYDRQDPEASPGRGRPWPADTAGI